MFDLAAFDWSGFLRDFWPNLVATVIGLILGLPIALWTNRWMLAHEQRAEGVEALARLRVGLESIRAAVVSNTRRSKQLVDLLRNNEAILDLGIDTTTWEVNRTDVVPLIRDPALRTRLGHYFERVATACRLGDALVAHNMALAGARIVSHGAKVELCKAITRMFEDVDADGQGLGALLEKALQSLPA